MYARCIDIIWYAFFPSHLKDDESQHYCEPKHDDGKHITNLLIKHSNIIYVMDGEFRFIVYGRN